MKQYNINLYTISLLRKLPNTISQLYIPWDDVQIYKLNFKAIPSYLAKINMSKNFSI